MTPKMPKEDPAVTAQRERERRLAQTDMEQTGMESTADLTRDLRRAYSSRYSLFGLR